MDLILKRNSAFPAFPPKILDVGARWLVAFVFFYAAFPKLFDPVSFAEIIDAYKILPDFLVMVAALFIPFFELLLGVGLLLNKRPGIWGSIGLLLLFIAVLSYAMWLGLDIDCGCFGPEDPESRAFSGLKQALVRDIILIIPLVYSLWYGSYQGNHSKLSVNYKREK